MDHRAQDELNAALDDGDDPIAKAEDGTSSEVGSADSVSPPQILFGQVRSWPLNFGHDSLIRLAAAEHGDGHQDAPRV